MERESQKSEIAKWRSAVFTVEASYLVPMIAVVTVIIIGYLFYVHQMVWCTCVSYESAFYGVQRQDAKEVTSAEAADLHIDERLKDSPLPIVKTTAEAEENANSVDVKWNISLLPDTFKSYFSNEGSVSVAKIEAPNFKRKIWLLRQLTD